MARWSGRGSLARAGTIGGRLVLYLGLTVVLTAVAISTVKCSRRGSPPIG